MRTVVNSKCRERKERRGVNSFDYSFEKGNHVLSSFVKSLKGSSKWGIGGILQIRSEKTNKKFIENLIEFVGRDENSLPV